MTPTFIPKEAASDRTGGLAVIGPARETQSVNAGPAPPAPPSRAVERRAGPARVPLRPTVEALSLEQVPLSGFINEVFSRALKLTVQIDQKVMGRSDLVTLRTGRPLPSEELFQMAQNILAGYGIGAGWDGSVLHIAPEEALMAQMPDLIRSRALPEVPLSLRPVFQIVDLHQVSANDMAAWLTNAYGAKVKIFTSGKSPTVMLFGLPENVSAAVDAINVLDQVRLAGRQSLRVSPVYWTARDLSAKLIDVLRAEGYDVATSANGQAGQAAPIILVPVEANNALIAFAADAKILAHVRQWTADLDRPGQVDPLRSIFIYHVQNTTAGSLGPILQNVLGGRAAVSSATTEVPLEEAGRTRAAALAGSGGQRSGLSSSSLGGAPSASGPGLSGATGGAGPTSAGPAGLGGSQQTRAAESDTAALTNEVGGLPSRGSETGAQAGAQPGSPPPARIVIDQARNALIVIGTAQDYQRIRPVLETLDRAPREALIEVTVAELTLSDAENLGVNFTATNQLNRSLLERLGTGTNVLAGGGGLPLGTSGFNYTILNGVGDVRVVLNAFAQNNRISILSTPRVLAKSGSPAKIEVGTEVPIITSQGSTNTIQNAGTTGILQSIDYRKTGILLNVRPIIHSGNRIDLTVSQEVSQALPNPTPGISSPLIQNRNVQTDLTLRDGQTVVIGGLISETRNAGDSGIPYLKDVPGIGSLFKNQQLQKDRTELLVFITPYVISNDAESAAITEQFHGQMRNWPIPSTQLRL